MTHLRRTTIFLASAAIAVVCGCTTKTEGGAEPLNPKMSDKVRVAAIQFHSRMGDVQGNLARLVPLLEKAASEGARICVLPECAIPGYADLTNDVFWSTKDEEGYLRVQAVAERVPGPSTEFLARLADRLDIYLTVPLIEREGTGQDEHFFNAVVLTGPEGRIRGHYRKRALWPVADAAWATEGPERLCIVDTEYGRLGLMICYDVHAVLSELGEAGADIVLHCVAWYGPNSGGWFDTVLARKVKKAGASLVLANWTFPEDPGWSGYGLSRVLGPDGAALARADRDVGSEIVMADVPCRPREDVAGK